MDPRWHRDAPVNPRRGRGLELQSRRTGTARLAILIARPTAIAGALTALVCLPLGMLVGAVGSATILVLQAVLLFFVSFWTHEVAHLLTIDRASLRRAGGMASVEGGWLSVHIVAPKVAVSLWSAAAGPLAGAGACFILGAAGLRSDVATAIGALQLVNLTALCPDGRVIRDRIFGGN